MNTKPRTKQPQVIRRRLLDGAAAIAAREGLAAVSIQAVADAADVTKGGVFHHFPSKHSLLEAMFEDVVSQLDLALDARMEPDESAYGRFTRAYIELVFADKDKAADKACATISAAMIADPDLKRIWSAWLRERLHRHRATDSAPILGVARLAADGVWFAGGELAGAEVERLLISLTRDHPRNA